MIRMIKQSGYTRRKCVIEIVRMTLKKATELLKKVKEGTQNLQSSISWDQYKKIAARKRVEDRISNDPNLKKRIEKLIEKEKEEITKKYQQKRVK